jgi:hypothetical protein
MASDSASDYGGMKMNTFRDLLEILREMVGFLIITAASLAFTLWGIGSIIDYAGRIIYG